MNLPIVQLRMEFLGEEIIHAFSERAEEFRPMVKEALDRILTEDNVKLEVLNRVRECFESAISNAIGSYEVRESLNKIIARGLSDMLLVPLNNTEENSNSQPTADKTTPSASQG